MIGMDVKHFPPISQKRWARTQPQQIRLRVGRQTPTFT